MSAMPAVIFDEPGLNEDRANWAQLAVDTFCEATEMGAETIETVIADLFADLCHLCERHGLHGEETFCQGYSAYNIDKTPGCIGSAEPVRRVAK